MMKKQFSVPTGKDVKNLLKQGFLPSILMVIALFAAGDVLAAEGLAPVTSFLETIVGVLEGMAVAVVTVALLWTGYILMFNRGNTGQIPFILGGALIVGGAGAISTWLAGAVG